MSRIDTQMLADEILDRLIEAAWAENFDAVERLEFAAEVLGKARDCCLERLEETRDHFED